jgi:hypothetical protein
MAEQVAEQVLVRRQCTGRTKQGRTKQSKGRAEGWFLRLEPLLIGGDFNGGVQKVDIWKPQSAHRKVGGRTFL